MTSIAKEASVVTNKRPFKQAIEDLGFEIKSERKRIQGIKKQLTIIKGIKLKEVVDN